MHDDIMTSHVMQVMGAQPHQYTPGSHVRARAIPSPFLESLVLCHKSSWGHDVYELGHREWSKNRLSHQAILSCVPIPVVNILDSMVVMVAAT